jgi:hypothetical protein
VQTPRFWGLPSSAGTVLFAAFNERGFRTNWFVVAMGLLLVNLSAKKQRAKLRARPTAGSILIQPAG